MDDKLDNLHQHQGDGDEGTQHRQERTQESGVDLLALQNGLGLRRQLARRKAVTTGFVE